MVSHYRVIMICIQCYCKTTFKEQEVWLDAVRSTKKMRKWPASFFSFVWKLRKWVWMWEASQKKLKTIFQWVTICQCVREFWETVYGVQTSNSGHHCLSKCAKVEWPWLKLTSNTKLRHLTFPSKTRGSNYNQQPQKKRHLNTKINTTYSSYLEILQLHTDQVIHILKFASFRIPEQLPNSQ